MSTDAAISLTSSTSEKPARSFVFHARLIGAITLLSRLLGMARESIAANYFGGGMVYSAFQFAFTVPNLFRKLLGEGALSAAFVPLYAQAVRNDERSANDFAAAGVNVLSAILIGLTILGEALLLRQPRLAPNDA